MTRKLLTPDQVNTINQFIVENSTNFGTAVMYLGMLSIERLAAVLLKERKIRQVSPQKTPFQGILKGILPLEKAKELQVFPLQVIDESGSRVLLLAMTDPLDTVAIHRVETISRMRVQPVFVSLDDLQWAYKKHFRSGLALFPSEVTVGGGTERTVSRRLDSLVGVPSSSASSSHARSNEVRALVAILVKKGIITAEEFEQELKKYGP